MMGNRYYITGVQLGMLIGFDESSDREHLVNEIIEKQDAPCTKGEQHD